MKFHKCYKCQEKKPVDSFHKNKSKPNGLSNTCKTCKKTLAKSYYSNNKSKYAEWSKSFRVKNPEYVKNYIYHYYRQNKEKYYQYSANRRAQKIKATPNWLRPEHLKEMEQFYWLARDLQSVTGEQYHVDHIVPLQGENVCGLHVPWNLQVLPADINLSKGNSYAEHA